MTFLKKLGTILKQGLQIAGVIAPAAMVAFPGQKDKIQVLSQDLADIATVIASVETFGQLQNLPGPEKAKLAGPMVAQVILRSAIVADRKIADPAKFAAGCQKVGEGMADILNSFREDDVDTINKVA